ncbi:Maf family protein [Feifania hominis]|uniref:Maf family protein n=1 Tax=Feifania hominis TaxID=2763660 RepID=UPI0024B5B833|nr:Maf family protein [Feifania hominis]
MIPIAIYLASQSPRRREILKNVGLDFKALTSGVDESFADGLPLTKLTTTLALAKADDVASRVAADDIVIGADTIVVLDGNILGKPRDESDAFAMLTLLSGNTHEVHTGLAVVRGEQRVTHLSVSRVTFKELTSAQIERYIATDEPYDKAGGYAAQGVASLFIERIDGDFFSVMGLPVAALGDILARDFGYPVL